MVVRGRDAGSWILHTKSIPPNKSKALEFALRLVNNTRSTRDVRAWWVKNKGYILLILEAETWPDRGEGVGAVQELMKVPPFTLHNIIHLEGPELLKMADLVRGALVAIHGIPKLEKVLYGDVYLVGQLTKAHHSAWYNIGNDDVYLRPTTRYGQAETHYLVHEFGHRYWHKFLSPTAQGDWGTEYYKSMMRGKIVFPDVGEPFGIPIRGYGDNPKVVKIVGDKFYVTETASIPRRDLGRLLQEKDGYPTAYSAASKSEYFAECFALYCLGKLEDPHYGIFEKTVGL